MSVFKATGQAVTGVMSSVITVTNTVNSTINLLNVASRAGNIKAAAWLNEVEKTTIAQAVQMESRIENRVADAMTLEARALDIKMQDPDYARHFANALEALRAAKS